MAVAVVCCIAILRAAARRERERGEGFCFFLFGNWWVMHYIYGADKPALENAQYQTLLFFKGYLHVYIIRVEESSSAQVAPRMYVCVKRIYVHIDKMCTSRVVEEISLSIIVFISGSVYFEEGSKLKLVLQRCRMARTMIIILKRIGQMLTTIYLFRCCRDIST